MNSANPRCLWSNLVCNASASNGCSDRNFTQANCLPKLWEIGFQTSVCHLLVPIGFQTSVCHLLVPAFWRHPAKRLEPFWESLRSIYELHLFFHGEFCWQVACVSGATRNPCLLQGANVEEQFWRMLNIVIPIVSLLLVLGMELSFHARCFFPHSLLY